MNTLAGKRCLLFGGRGFFGSHVRDALLREGADVYCPKSDFLDLDGGFYNDAWSTELFGMEQGGRFDYILNFSAKTGGLIWNRSNPADIYGANVRIGMNAANLARQIGCIKYINIITSCSYGFEPEVLYESELHKYEPHPSVAQFAYAKRTSEIYCRALHKQHGLNAITLAVTNLYGPRDSLDLVKTKFVGALIVKLLAAKAANLPSVELLGDGTPKREILYVGDAAKLVVKALLNYEDNELPLNIGRGMDWTIANIAHLIRARVGYTGGIVFGGNETGQMKKFLSPDRTRSCLGIDENFYTSLTAGLTATVEDYKLRLGYEDDCVHKMVPREVPIPEWLLRKGAKPNE